MFFKLSLSYNIVPSNESKDAMQHLVYHENYRTSIEKLIADMYNYGIGNILINVRSLTFS